MAEPPGTPGFRRYRRLYGIALLTTLLCVLAIEIVATPAAGWPSQNAYAAREAGEFVAGLLLLVLYIRGKVWRFRSPEARQSRSLLIMTAIAGATALLLGGLAVLRPRLL